MPSFRDAPYRRILKNINLVDALMYIAKCSLSIWSEMYVRQNLQPIYMHREQVGRRISEPYNLSTLAYLASEIIANARDRKWKFGLDYFNEGIKFINSSIKVVEELQETDADFRPIQILLSQAYAQMELADRVPLFNKFGRYDLLFDEIAYQDGTGAMPQILSRFPDFRNGLSIKELLLLRLPLPRKQG